MRRCSVSQAVPPGTDIFTKSDRPLNYSENTRNFDSETGPRLPGKETGESLPAAPAIPAERSGTGRKPIARRQVKAGSVTRQTDDRGKKRTRLLYGLLLLCAPLAGCLKEDDGSQFYSDVYWFPLAKQTFSVDTREPEPVDTVVLVFRARNFVYDSDTVNFAVMPRLDDGRGRDGLRDHDSGRPLREGRLLRQPAAGRNRTENFIRR